MQNDFSKFNVDCRLCPRLADFLDEVGRQYPDYHARPVAPFGATDARLLIVGLAPGMHGANATGRPFTGDHAGIMLYQTMHAFGHASAPESISRDDGLMLSNCRITNAVKCLPPQNKPVGDEINRCNQYLHHEIHGLPENSVVLALGTIAHNAVLKSLGLKMGAFKFGHNAVHKLDGIGWMVDSYHCSRYNTQTKRLTQDMFNAVFDRVNTLLESNG